MTIWPVWDCSLPVFFHFWEKNFGEILWAEVGSPTNRFAFFTGNVMQNLPLANCTDALLELLKTEILWAKEIQPVQQEIVGEVINEDDPRTEDIICALRWDKIAPKLVRLFNEGDITGYASQSEADAALCAIITFRAGPDPALLSALYRDDKWEQRADYRSNAINCGIAAWRGVYHISLKEKPGFITIYPKTGAECICATRLARHIRENLRYRK